MMNIENDRLFLLSQRQKGRPGSMIGVDRNLTEREQRKTIRQEEAEIRRQRFDAMAEVEELVQLESTSSSDEPEYSAFKGPSITEEPDLLNEPRPNNPKKPRGKQDVINMKLVASLDNCKVSDCNAVRIIIASAESLGHNLNDLIINRSSVRRMRHRLRAERTSKLREIF
ncbi:uncharacterized protein LOC143374755 [Andrena cerasifolii]|uniref:uncharacterized protein LOC143374755 n=1 Tax=Andrena cerasifolii TaxID=2819439 RepID=UPI00403795A8